MNKPLQPGPEEHAGRPPTKWPARMGLRRYSAAEFLISLVLLFTVVPLMDLMRNGYMLEAIVMTLVLMFGVLAVGKSRLILVLGILIATPAIIARWASHVRPDLVPQEFFLIPALLYVIFIIARFLVFILRARHVSSEVLCTGMSTYLLLGLLWCFAYRLDSDIDSHAFSVNLRSASEALYFSLITLTTVGYGDIVPVSNVARMLAALEAMTGTLFVAVLIARLVALYSSQPPSEPGDRDRHAG